MNSTILYPSGFSRTISEEGKLVLATVRPKVILKSEFERPVSEIFHGFVARNEMNPGWDFRRQTLITITQTYGDFWAWAEQQLVTNDYIYDTSKDFLLDTLQYIVTGKRAVNIMNWRDLLFDYPDARPRAASKERYNLMKEIVGKNSRNNYISMWCSHERGFEDMILATNLFFGQAKLPLKG